MSPPDQPNSEATMPPNTNETGVLFEDDARTPDLALTPEEKQVNIATDRKLELVWRNIIFFVYIHLSALYGVYLLFTSSSWKTNLFTFILYWMVGLGITAGAHRQWSHKAYKAKWPLRLILVCFNTIAFQDSVIDWARDHRMHHKYSETDADPYNSTRGLFFSHVGWLLCRKHPDLKEKGKGIDVSDLYADPILRFQKKHYMILMPLACFIVPTLIPMYFWGESFSNAWHVATMLRHAFNLNVTWLVNSAAHKWGGKPYDKNIKPSQNFGVTMFALGEGYHNYHHTFPWDYQTAELGDHFWNPTTWFINCFAKLGWAYELKTVSKEIIEKRVKRTGDGTHNLWGWGDRDQPKEEVEKVTILHKKDN